MTRQLKKCARRVQQTIDSQYLDPECLDCVGETAWDDWTDHLDRRYPPPEVDRETVDWEAIGKFLVEWLNLNLWVDTWFEDDEFESGENAS